MNFLKSKGCRLAAAGVILSSSLAFGGTHYSVAEPLPTPQGQGTVVQPPVKVQCSSTYAATKYTISDLVPTKKNSCGQVTCTAPRVLAEVYSSTCTGRVCGDRMALRQIRCERRNCGSCDLPTVAQRIQDLESYSPLIRRGAVVSLRQCGLIVQICSACIDEPVPVTHIYAKELLGEPEQPPATILK